ncbi:PAS domain-containing sensor histidine kinase [Yunchengibacter salinarum]|uniref:PAS domain-containing sensor histidine kinase n=1 Tax=Yunchengibacter salinarum TaxID=3133399 RepID=UPI0035B5E754
MAAAYDGGWCRYVRDENVTGRKTDDMAGLLDGLAEAVMVLRGAEVLYHNAPMVDLLGGDGDPLSGSIDHLVHPEDREILLDTSQRCLDGAWEPVVFRFRLLCPKGDDGPEGNVRWVECRARSITWQGAPAMAACLFDVTDTVAEARAETRAREMFQSVFSLSPEVLMITRLSDRRLVDVNPAFLNVFGLRRDQVLGRTPDELGVWADPMFQSRFAEELKMTASMADVPVTVRTRGGLVRHFRLFVQKIEEIDNPLLLIIGRDVTDDLLQAQELQRSRDMAELANRAKSEFLANMSHELRTPLNAILGFAEIIRDEILGPIHNARYREYAEDIHVSGTHLLAIINDILDLSKVEAERLDTEIRWINPRDCIEMAMTMIKQRSVDAGLMLREDIDRGLEIEADERLVKQICLNLLANSVKFTETGGRIFLKLRQATDGGAILMVEDTGLGMTEEEVKLARRPFGQVDTSMTRRQSGSGLGLPLVAAFAEKMEAHMAIDSVPGKGTRVSITFPPEKVRMITGAPNASAVAEDIRSI